MTLPHRRTPERVDGDSNQLLTHDCSVWDSGCLEGQEYCPSSYSSHLDINTSRRSYSILQLSLIFFVYFKQSKVIKKNKNIFSDLGLTLKLWRDSLLSAETQQWMRFYGHFTKRNVHSPYAPVSLQVLFHVLSEVRRLLICVLPHICDVVTSESDVQVWKAVLNCFAPRVDCILGLIISNAPTSY